MNNKPSYEELKISEENYRNLFSNNPLSLWEEDFSEVVKLLNNIKNKGIKISKEYFDKNMGFFTDCVSAVKILNINKATLDLFGYKSKKELEKDFSATLNTKSLETFKKGLVAIAYNKKSFIDETEFVCADGKVIAVIIQFQVVERFQKIVFTITDITKLKKTEKALKESKEKFSDIFRLSHYALVLSDISTGIIIETNPVFSEITGYKKEELIGKSTIELKLWSEENRKKLSEKIKKQGFIKNEEVSIYTKAGKKIDVQVSVIIFTINSKPVVYTTMSDITERKKAEQALVESENRFKAFFEANYEGIFISENGVIVDVNEAACKTTGYSYKESIGMNAIDFIAADYRELVKNNMRTDFEKPYDVVAELKNGTRLPVEIQGRTFEYKGKKARIAAVRDISERKQVEEVMLRTSRMEATATLAAGIAHDFNNLMVGVLGNADLLKMKYDKDPETIDKLTIIADSACKAGDLAQQLLAFAKAGKYQPKIMNLNDIVKDTPRSNEWSFPSRIKIERDIDSDLLNIKADSAQMNQVVMNLCINSVEAIESTGCISISTSNINIDEKFAKYHPSLKMGPYICLTIKDNGSGMDKKTLSKIFEPFFSMKFTGRGLGLAAVFGIIENHDGYISVQSEVGVGTTFKIYLPAVELKVLSEQEPTNDIPIGTETILVIDDEILVLDVTQSILEYFGYNVLLAHDGQEAVDIIKSFEGKIHLALLDMAMPVMGGVEAFPLIKKISPEIKVIICSGYELDLSAQSLLDEGANSFIQKPFSMDKMACEIRRVLDII